MSNDQRFVWKDWQGLMSSSCVLSTIEFRTLPRPEHGVFHLPQSLFKVSKCFLPHFFRKNVTRIFSDKLVTNCEKSGLFKAQQRHRKLDLGALDVLTFFRDTGDTALCHSLTLEEILAAIFFAQVVSVQVDAFCTSRSHHSRCREPAGYCKETHSRAARDACGRCLACCSVPQLRHRLLSQSMRNHAILQVPGLQDYLGTSGTHLPEKWTTIPADTLAFRTAYNLCLPMSVAIQQERLLIWLDGLNILNWSLNLWICWFRDFCSNQCLPGAVEIDPPNPRRGTWGHRVHLRSFGRRWHEVPCEATWHVLRFDPVVFHLENPSAFKATFERFDTCLCRIEAARLQRCCLHRLPQGWLKLCWDHLCTCSKLSLIR